MAHHNCNNTFSIFELDSHNVCYKLCNGSLSYRTTTYGRFSFNYCLSKTATAGLATCAAICAPVAALTAALSPM